MEGLGHVPILDHEDKLCGKRVSETNPFEMIKKHSVDYFGLPVPKYDRSNSHNIEWDEKAARDKLAVNAPFEALKVDTHRLEASGVGDDVAYLSVKADNSVN
jgi:hypothetical protein